MKLFRSPIGQNCLCSQDFTPPTPPQVNNKQHQADAVKRLKTLADSRQSREPHTLGFSRSPIASFADSTSKMAPPTPLAIATQAVNRLVKEESYYHKDQASQEKRIAKLEDEIATNSPDLDSNAEYILKQEVGRLRRLQLCLPP